MTIYEAHTPARDELLDLFRDIVTPAATRAYNEMEVRTMTATVNKHCLYSWECDECRRGGELTNSHDDANAGADAHDNEWHNPIEEHDA